MAEDISDHIRVFRVIRRTDVVTLDDGGTRPQSCCFSDHSDDGAMSVYLEDDIMSAGKKPEDLLQLWGSSYQLCYHTAKQYRELGQIITRAPNETFPGHANVSDVTGKRTAARKSKLARSAAWFDDPGPKTR